jgi:hypothetical protein
MTTFYPTTNGIEPIRQPATECVQSNLLMGELPVYPPSQKHRTFECRVSRDSFTARHSSRDLSDP